MGLKTQSRVAPRRGMIGGKHDRSRASWASSSLLRGGPWSPDAVARPAGARGDGERFVHHAGHLLISRLKYEWSEAIMSESGPTSSTVRLVLLVLFTHMNGDGSNCYPGVRMIATKTGLHRTTVMEAIRQAREDGWIAVEKRRGGKRGGDYHYYRPLFPTKAVAESDRYENGEAVAEPDQLGNRSGRDGHGSGRFQPLEVVGEADLTNTETSPLETPWEKSPDFAIALLEPIPSEWQPPEKLTEYSALYSSLTDAERQFVAVELTGTEAVAVQPRELINLSSDTLRQLQYAAASRNGGVAGGVKEQPEESHHPVENALSTEGDA